MVNKYTRTDHSTSRASEAEKDRIFQSFVKRVEDFESTLKPKIPFRYEIIFNPSSSELENTEKLKDSLFWKLDEYARQFSSSIGVLKAKLTLFRFETKGINNLLFSISTPTNAQVVKPVTKGNLEMSIFKEHVSNVIKAVSSNELNAFVCLVGDDTFGADVYVETFANQIKRNIVVITINDILRDSTFLKKTIAKEKNQIIYLKDFDYLFSDLTGTPKILNRELSMLRNDLLVSLNSNFNTIILSVSSALIIPREISVKVDVVDNFTDLGKTEIDKFVATTCENLGVNEINQICMLLSDMPISFILKEMHFIKSQFGEGKKYDVLKHLEWKVNNFKKTRAEFNKVEGADFKIVNPSTTLDRVVMSDENRSKLDMALSSIVNQELIYHKWGWSEIDPNVRTIINFYGPPGTGKTMCANAIAHELSKRTGFEYQLLSLNYSEIESMYVGEAPKKLERVFNFSKDKRLVLFFDEADSFLGKRIQNVSQGSEQAINSLRSTMLIQLEKYHGVVIFATNLTTNYDAAFKTRFLAEIEFPLPDKQVCIEIFRKNIPDKLQSYIANSKFSTEELSLIGDALVSLSGRDIKTIIWRVLLKASLKEGSNHVFTASDFINEAGVYKTEKAATNKSIALKGVTSSITPASQELAQRLGLNPGEQKQDKN